MKQIEEIIRICQEVLNGETFLEESVITEILGEAREARKEVGILKDRERGLHREIGRYSNEVAGIAQANRELAEKVQGLAKEMITVKDIWEEGR